MLNLWLLKVHHVFGLFFASGKNVDKNIWEYICYNNDEQAKEIRRQLIRSFEPGMSFKRCENAW